MQYLGLMVCEKHLKLLQLRTINLKKGKIHPLLDGTPGVKCSVGKDESLLFALQLHKTGTLILGFDRVVRPQVEKLLLA